LKTLKPATMPGQVVSMDQLVSPTPGFVPFNRDCQKTLNLNERLSLLVDHFSDFTYIHLMTKMNGNTTVAAQLEFERVLNSYGVCVIHYHAKNGLFDTKVVFKASVSKEAGQTLSFCGVNAHHQNGKAENQSKTTLKTLALRCYTQLTAAPKPFMPPFGQQPLRINSTCLIHSLPTKYTAEEKKQRRKILVVQPATFCGFSIITTVRDQS